MITDKMVDLAAVVLHSYEHNRHQPDDAVRLAKETIEAFASYGPAHRESVSADIARIERYFGRTRQ